jgi:protein TonB
VSTPKPIPQQHRPAPNDTAGEFSSTLGRALFQQRIQKLLQSAMDSTGTDGIAVSLLQGSEYVCQASRGLAPEVGVSVKPGEGVCGRCLLERSAVVQSGIDGEIKSVVAAPIIMNGKLQGLVAGFSLDASPFSTEVVQKFQILADTVSREIEPPTVVELNPENDDLLDQLGFQPAELRIATDEDPNYLPEIVLEVLQGTPSKAPSVTEAESGEVLSELMGVREECLPAEHMQEIQEEAQRIVDLETQQHPAAEPQTAETEHDGQTAPEMPLTVSSPSEIEAPKAEMPFFHNTDPKRGRTTEDVLMDLVQQSLQVPAVTAPVPKAENSAVIVEQPTTPDESIPAARANAETQPADTVTPVVLNPTELFQEQQAPEKSLEGFSEGGQEKAFSTRIVLLAAAALLIVAIGISLTLYIRKPSPAPTPQPVAVQPAESTSAPAMHPQQPSTQTNQDKDSSVASRPEERTKQASTRAAQPEPLMVASNGTPRRPAGTVVEAEPASLTGIAVKPSSIELPSPSTNVVFGGRRSSGVVPAKLLRRVEPTYPPMARTMRLSGDIRMDITVAEDGHVKGVANVNGIPLLAASAVEAVKKWRYVPAMQDGKPVESTVDVTIRFR